MPRLVNSCAICGKPIVKQRTICRACKDKQDAQVDEIEQSMYVARLRLIPEILWEKRRAEFAAQAMQGLLANPTYFDRIVTPTGVASLAVRYADALCAELRKNEKFQNK